MRQNTLLLVAVADLQYKNVRPDYLNAIWNVVNFGDVSRRLEEATKLA